MPGSICPRATLKHLSRPDPCISSHCSPNIQLPNSLPRAQGNKMWDGAIENPHRSKRRARALLKVYLGLISCHAHAPQWSNYENPLQCGDMWRRRVLMRWQDSLWHAKSCGISCFRTALRENQSTTATRLEALFENYLVLCLGKNGKLQHIGLYLPTCVRNTVVALAPIYLALSTLKPNYSIQFHRRKSIRKQDAGQRETIAASRKAKALLKAYLWFIFGAFLPQWSNHVNPFFTGRK